MIVTPEHDQVRIVVGPEMHVVHHSDREPGAHTVRSCERISDHPIEGVQVSDHYGLSAELAAP